MPATLCSEHGWKRKPINPVFFAPTDIQPGGLTEELKNRLKASKNLIVICSPNSARSEWVGKEIEYFHELGRDKDIHFFIVDGIPNSGDPATECFNPVVKQLNLPEILGANIHEKIFWLPYLNRERAYVQLISKLLGVEFDSIWKRHKRQLIVKASYLLCGIVMLLVILYLFAIPVRLTTDVELQKSQLPIGDVITLRINGAEYISETKRISFDPILLPGYKRFSEINISAGSEYFTPVDTLIRPGLGLKKQINIYLRRDSTFAIYSGNVYDENMNIIEGVQVEVDSIVSVTDASGYFLIYLPLDRQRTESMIRLKKKGYKSIERIDETPGSNLKYIMHEKQ